MKARILLIGLVGCSALPTSALVKAPVDQQCRQMGLKGCPHLVDGVILYVEGNEPGAREKIQRARVENTPEDLKRFARNVACFTLLPTRNRSCR